MNIVVTKVILPNKHLLRLQKRKRTNKEGNWF